MADEPKKHKRGWKPGGERGKLHRELGVPEGEKIPARRLAEAEHSENPEIRRDAVRAKTMEGWRHGGGKPAERAETRRETMYDHPRSRKLRAASHGA